MQMLRLASILSLFLVSVFTMYAQSIEKPEIIRFGENKSMIMLELDKVCKIVEDRQITPIELPTATHNQSQVDCNKFDYAGKKRKAEFVFADDILDLVWIFIDSTESQTFIDGFTALYGQPSHKRPDAVFFLDHGAAVRTEPHEVLFFSDRLKEPYREWLKK